MCYTLILYLYFPGLKALYRHIYLVIDMGISSLPGVYKASSSGQFLETWDISCLKWKAKCGFVYKRTCSFLKTYENLPVMLKVSFSVLHRPGSMHHMKKTRNCQKEHWVGWISVYSFLTHNVHIIINPKAILFPFSFFHF